MDTLTLPARARRFGFAGKLCIRPGQVAGIHEAFQPDTEDVEWARGLLKALAARPEDQRGSFAYLGEMVDRPVIERAWRIQAATGHGPVNTCASLNSELD